MTRTAVITLLPVILTSAALGADLPGIPTPRNIGNFVDRAQLRSQVLIFNEQVEGQIADIAARLAKVSAQPDLVITVRLINSPEINASGAPGGFVFLNSGLLDSLSGEEQLASLLAIEIARIAGGQDAKRLQNDADAVNAGAAVAVPTFVGLTAVSLGLAIITGGVYLDLGTPVATAAGGGVALGVTTQFHKEQVFEADREAANILQKAHYDPAFLLTTLQYLEKIRLERIAKGAGFLPQTGLLVGDPKLSERIAELQSVLAKLPHPPAASDAPARGGKRP